ncbi:MAG: hypothetical protein COT67_01800 [Candidatus Tagabacteria bacterium CG09_land_8_20_14_0_10_41_14]|uniref:(P)ppGpp synthetase n=2 Tax=Candidatus Tagaibacteriota TaxID=1817918 RepID=A0A2H0WLB6_9BACT|nr:MAG: hypothetical protein COT67_01800 [Candidatus Tagabacteria bacterium CG09_land_8_20_14_0_10_41_14]PJE73010.1 MAG: hypothetical protein COV00_02355 [Candidatus Tagabacteria bacterium CG10_big_fil_rev_8_21_14_0_10_40_13]
MNWEEYKNKLPPKYSERELNLLEKAFIFAAEIHKDEKRQTGEAYITHPAIVSLKAANLNLGTTTIAAAMLHDTIESEKTDIKTIQKKFGHEIAFLVKGLSKVSKIEYRGVERAAESTRKMFMAMAQDIRVIIIKLLDRLHNLETLSTFSEEKQKRIGQETLDIYAPVADRLGMGDLKLQLEDEAFKYAHPKEYEWIIKETREKIPQRKKYLTKKVIPAIKKELEKEKIPVRTITHRAKHYYSLWKKLLRNNMDWYTIYDLTAVRIIVDSVESCYATLGVIHKLWKPLPGRIKDYIALPKQNGYKSLHTTVFCIDKKITEFQIRTPKMHEEAEQGIAAHWAWEIAGKPKSPRETQMPHKKFTWIKQLQDWHKKFNKDISGEKFLESLKIDFFKDRVFVLTPKGDIIDLPEGSTPIDFAYHVHSDIGNSIVGAKVNNSIVPLSYELASGDMVEILTQKNKKPNLKMLESIKTSLAKNQIRSALKRQELMPKLRKPQKELRAELTLIVKDRIGMLKDISFVFSKFRINIKSLHSKEKENSNNEYAIVSVAFSPKNKEQVNKIATQLKTIKGIEEVRTKIN